MTDVLNNLEERMGMLENRMNSIKKQMESLRSEVHRDLTAIENEVKIVNYTQVKILAELQQMNSYLRKKLK